MEIDPAGGGAGVTSGPSAATSATAARRRTPGRWRRIPRAVGPSENVGMARLEIDPVGGGTGATSGAAGSGPSATAARLEDPVGGGAGVSSGPSGSRPSATASRPRTAGPSEESRSATVKPGKKLAPTRRSERSDPSPSTGRLRETGVDQKISLPSFRFEIVSDPKDPTNYKTVLVEEKIPPTVTAEILADQKIASTHPLLSTGLLQERPHLLQVDMMVVEKGSRECEEMEERSRQMMLEQAKRLEKEAEEGPCDTEEHTEEDKAEFRALKLMYAAACRSAATKHEYIFKPPSDTIEEHLTAEEMENQANISGWPVCSQAQHFATIALEWYNSTKKTHKFEIAKVLLSKCFTDVDYNTYAHVNFTATPTSHSDSPKRLFFAELMLASNLLACKDTEPMRVLTVSIIDDSCFGGCHEMVRDIKGPVRKDMDYERCHACSERIKHPRGDLFVGGHNRRRMPYVSAFPWTYKSP